MGCINLDMTIDGILADPVIGAAMRADRVDAKGLETMLRATATRLDGAQRTPATPFDAVGLRLRRAAHGLIASW